MSEAAGPLLQFPAARSVQVRWTPSVVLPPVSPGSGGQRRVGITLVDMLEDQPGGFAQQVVVSVLVDGAALVGPEAGAAAVMLQPAMDAGLQHVVRVLGRRRIAHGVEVLELAAEDSRQQLAALVEQAVRDEEHQEFLARVLTVAQDMAGEEKRRALARSLAAAAVGEDAVLDEEFLFVRVVADLDAPHIRLLARLDGDRAGAGQLAGQTVRDGWTQELLADVEAGLGAALPALLSTLESHALAEHQANWAALEGAPLYRITGRGQALMRRLQD